MIYDSSVFDERLTCRIVYTNKSVCVCGAGLRKTENNRVLSIWLSAGAEEEEEEEGNGKWRLTNVVVSYVTDMANAGNVRLEPGANRL